MSFHSSLPRGTESVRGQLFQGRGQQALGDPLHGFVALLGESSQQREFVVIQAKVERRARHRLLVPGFPRPFRSCAPATLCPKVNDANGTGSLKDDGRQPGRA